MSMDRPSSSDRPRRGSTEYVAVPKLRPLYWALQPELLEKMQEILPRSETLEVFVRAVSELSQDPALSAMPFPEANLMFDIRGRISNQEAGSLTAGKWKEALAGILDEQRAAFDARPDKKPTLKELMPVRVELYRKMLMKRFYPGSIRE